MTPVPAGASWKELRESLGKTIAQVSAELRIGQRYLAGIEEGNYGDFPERVFSTGFIRAYAKYLSQDPGPVLAEYERSIGSRDDSDTAAQLRFGWVERDRERGSRRATYTLAAGAVLLIGVILAWVTLRTDRRPLPPPPPPAAAVAPRSPIAVENTAKTGDNAVAAAPSDVDNMAVPILPPPQTGPTPAEPTSSVAAVGGTGALVGPFQLFLEASEQAWVMYSFDDGEPIDVTLYAGDKISIQAKKRITLKLGNAGGVAGTLNGQRLPPFGERGQVRKLTFGQ
ncbi:helix-turn-helix domain-containing protein [Candidatus Deferrimicrobium sp.]|uniref:helix-turn-helix domain-containing protein n=1 Tax=Candidatus Deferrimicrobium sp. TaxID=3060586 RepID=UPI002ED10512